MDGETIFYRTSLDGEHWTLIEAESRDDAVEIGASIHRDDSFYVGAFTRNGLIASEFIDREYKKK